MKKIFIKKLILVIFSCMLLILFLGYYLITFSTLQNFRNTSEIKINQISQILSTNTNTIATLSDATYEDYLSKARAVAYIVENNPEVIDNSKELMHLAVLMQIDQIHIFDAYGVIIAGTIAEYVGVGVDDGEQIGYFKAILEDSAIELVQKITPATADGVLMQYAGVARKDKKGIVQIGMEPKRMIETLSRNKIAYVLSMVVSDENENILLVDKKTGLIEESTNSEYDLKNLYDLGFDKEIVQNSTFGEFLEIENAHYFATLSESKSGMICITIDKNTVVSEVMQTVVIIALCIVLISITMILIIKKLLEVYVIHGIKEIITSLKAITLGNLDTVITVDSNPEFKELSGQINKMVGYLLQSTAKISRIIDAVDINIAIYEYGNKTNNVVTTNRLAEMLGFSNEDIKRLFANKELFENRVSSICEKTADAMIYKIQLSKGERYLKIKTFHDFNTTMGIVVDVTDDVLRENEIIHDRDYDILTGLYNRRAFTCKVEKLFSNPQKLKVACVMMIDMDGLKKVNDLYGHSMGDSYLKAGVDIISLAAVSGHSLISRLGGDEFVIILYGYDNKKQIIEKINEVNTKMMDSNIALSETKTYPVRFSAGYVFYSSTAQEISMLLSNSDIAMYVSKQRPDCEFVHYESYMSR